MNNYLYNLLKLIIFSLCIHFSKVYNYSIAIRIRGVKSKLFTYWISSNFKSIGRNSIVNYPFVFRGGKYITIGDHVGLGGRGILTAWDTYMKEHFVPEITIGDNTFIGEDYHISAINKIIIGENVLIGKKVTISDNSHGKVDSISLGIPPSKRFLYSKGPVIIEDNVWIGDKSTILAGVTIGKNSIIGANAVVTSNVLPNCVVGGIPAKLIKKID